jgi:NAD(P)-dependent dehydrogenase (short-subunit alcohol dehydrogenase family)
MNFDGKNVVITGASRGLGRALAGEFVRRGARVVGAARGGADLEAALLPLRAGGGVAYGVVADVGDPAAAARIAGEASALLGPIDILVQNASVLGPVPLPLLLDLPPGAAEAVFAANVFGPLRLAQALVGGMVLRGHGLVVSISSDAAVSPYPGWGAYGASKAALDHLTRVMAAELEGTGVRTLVFDPGEMDTRMHADAIPDADPATLARPEDAARRLLDRLAAGTDPSGARVAS